MYRRKIAITLSCLVAVTLGSATVASAATMASFDGRVDLGSTPGWFFDPASGFNDGVDTSHTNTVSFNDGVVQMDLTIKVEGFGADGVTPAPINVIPTAAGVQEISIGDDRINSGESLKFTYTNIAFSVIGASPMGPVDTSSFQALLSTIRLVAWDPGTDSVIYTGVGAPPTLTENAPGRFASLALHTNITTGDMFRITAGANSNFRARFLSQAAHYSFVPEPTTLGLLAVGLIGAVCSRRKR